MERDDLDELIDEIRDQEPEFDRLWEPVELADRLRERRKALGLTQTEVGERMGAPTSRVSEIERNPARVSVSRLMRYMAAIEARLEMVPNTMLKKRTRKARAA